MGKRPSNTNSNFPHRIPRKTTPDERKATSTENQWRPIDSWQGVFRTTKSETLRVRRRHGRSENVPVDSGRFALCRENEQTRNLSANQPPWAKGIEAETIQPPSSPPTIGVLVLDEVRRHYFKKACESRPQNLRGREVRRRKGKIANRSSDDSGRTTSGMVQPPPGRSITIGDRSRIHRGVRRCKGCSLWETIVPRDPESYDQYSDPDNRQRGSLPHRTNNQLPQKEPRYRPQISLSEAAETAQIAETEYHFREEQPCRYLHETTSDEQYSGLEEELDVD